jgi:plastocyanin
MSKVQVDTIVDKDDISAPSLTKGAIVTGVCTATSFDGAISEWVLGANGSSDYTFTGSGLTGAENDPTLYLKRGQKYRFKNSSGGHPFRIQSTANGSAGTAYNDGVTNNDAGDGTTLEWDVQFDAPSVLYYQCTAHGSMGGKIYIGNSGNSSTLVDLNVSGVTTTGIATVTTSVVVGSAVTANADGVITAGVGTFGSVVSSGAISGTTGTYTGQLSVADKVQFTVASPQLEFNNGGPRLWSPAANTLTIHTGGGFDSASNERLRVTSAGLVGVGTTIPDDQLTVRGSNGSGLRVGDGTANVLLGTGAGPVGRLYTITNHGLILGTNDSERLRIGTSGEIGIAGANYGTSGQVLTSGGSGAAVSWADAAGGAWELITSGLVDSGGEYEIMGSTSTLTSSYQMFRLTFYTEQTPSAGESGLQLQIYNGAWREDTNYGYGWISNGGSVDSQTSAKGILLGKMGRRFEGVVQFSNPSQTTRPKWFSARLASMNSDDAWSEPLNFQVNGQYNNASTKNDAVTGIRLRSTDSAPAGGEGGGQNFSGGYYLLEGCAIS